MKLSKFTFLFFAIIVFAGFLRLFQLDTVPPGPNRDEASIGYTAYSILQTGKDEYGKVFPLSFQSFGDWKLPVYIYETVITVAIFGLNIFAVRLPSALAGIIGVILVYFLVFELFRNRKIALLSMSLMAISPWALHLSRVESESNTAVVFTTAGVLLLLKGLNKKDWRIIPGVLLLSLTFGTYAGNYIFTPLLAFGIFLIFRKEVIKHKLGLISIILFILGSAFIWFQTTSANITKISGTGIFGDPSVVDTQIITPIKEHNLNPISKIFHNKPLYGIQKFSQNYLNAFSPEFLFIKGGNNHAHNILNFGNMYLIEAPFLLLGFVYLLKKRNKANLLVLWWLLIAPIAPSITKDAPHTNRMFAIFPILPLVTAFGVVWILDFFKTKRFAITGLVIFLFALNFAVYMDRYYVHFPYEESGFWGKPYEKLNNLLSKEFHDKKIVMEGYQESPYIYFLFYRKFDPNTYRNAVKRYPITSDGFIDVKSFDQFTFRDINWCKDLTLPNTVLVTRAENLPKQLKNDFRVSEVILDNGPIFSMVETNPRIQIPKDLSPTCPE